MLSKGSGDSRPVLGFRISAISTADRRRAETDRPPSLH
jgi:hypothetical protein